MSQIQTLKGFRDFLPNVAKKRQWVIAQIQSVFETFGFDPLETPALEYESLLLGKYGAEADKLLYNFEDKGGRRVALRYDQTVPTARVVAQYRNELSFPFRRYQMQPVWRADKPQKGRYREFLQCDADIVGSTSPLSDAEVLAVFYAIYKKLGFAKIQLRINDRPSLIASIQSAGVPESDVFSVIQTIDKLDKKSKEEVTAELSAKKISDKSITALFSALDSTNMPQNLVEITNYARMLGVEDSAIVYTPTLARGLDYYTGLIFEAIIPGYSAGSVGGGGRYDKLLSQLVGVDMPACGFAVGFDRTVDALDDLKILGQNNVKTPVLVAVFSADLLPKSLEVATALRNNNIQTEIYADTTKKLESQLKYADKKGLEYAIIIGPEEAASELIVIKNLRTKKQEKLSLEQTIKLLS